MKTKFVLFGLIVLLVLPLLCLGSAKIQKNEVVITATATVSNTPVYNVYNIGNGLTVANSAAGVSADPSTISGIDGVAMGNPVFVDNPTSVSSISVTLENLAVPGLNNVGQLLTIDNSDNSISFCNENQSVIVANAKVYSYNNSNSCSIEGFATNIGGSMIVTTPSKRMLEISRVTIWESSFFDSLVVGLTNNNNRPVQNV